MKIAAGIDKILPPCGSSLASLPQQSISAFDGVSSMSAVARIRLHFGKMPDLVLACTSRKMNRRLTAVRFGTTEHL
jgi:hypothetical protein